MVYGRYLYGLVRTCVAATRIREVYLHNFGYFCFDCNKHKTRSLFPSTSFPLYTPLSLSLFHSLTAVKVFAYKHSPEHKLSSKNCQLYFYELEICTNTLRFLEWLRSWSEDHVTLSRFRWLSSKCQVRIHQSLQDSSGHSRHHTKGVFGEFFFAKIFR